jgi:hypothetical protein
MHGNQTTTIDQLTAECSDLRRERHRLHRLMQTIDEDLRRFDRGRNHPARVRLIRERADIEDQRAALGRAIRAKEAEITDAKRLLQLGVYGDLAVTAMLREAAQRTGHLEAVYHAAVDLHCDPSEFAENKFHKSVIRAMKALGAARQEKTT